MHTKCTKNGISLTRLQAFRQCIILVNKDLIQAHRDDLISCLKDKYFRVPYRVSKSVDQERDSESLSVYMFN